MASRLVALQATPTVFRKRGRRWYCGIMETLKTQSSSMENFGLYERMRRE